MKKLLLLFTLLAVAVGFSSCEKDHYDTLYDQVVGRRWIGDLGMTDRIGPLESGVFLASDGFGNDELYDYNTHEFVDRLNIQWYTDNWNVYISYGNVAAPRELRNAYVDHGYLIGTLYIDHTFYGSVRLRMQ